ncbi:MAG: helix-turn-helix domain-containing protein [Cytophagales bacterium]|nr:helix-turn-helix domain-containing protein [Cytophagales bacterium]
MTEVLEMLKTITQELEMVKTFLLENRNHPTTQKEWLDGQEVLMYLHISKRTLQNLRTTEMLPYSQVKGKFYYRLADVQTLLESNYSKRSSKAE